MDPPQVTDVQYGNAWIPLNHNKFGKTSMSHAGYAVTKKTCESCSIRHSHWKTKTKYSLNKTCCHQGQPVPKEQSFVFRYSMHEDSGEKKMDIVIYGSGSIHVFCETRALEQFYNKWSHIKALPNYSIFPEIPHLWDTTDVLSTVSMSLTLKVFLHLLHLPSLSLFFFPPFPSQAFSCLLLCCVYDLIPFLPQITNRSF